MTVPPLYIPAFPTVGPTGERDNLRRLAEVQGALLPEGKMLVIDVLHDDGCPCAEGRRSPDVCTCETVDVTLRIRDPRTS